MTFTYNEVMKKFYEDEKLGIKSEDAPANATGAAVAGTGSDVADFMSKKKQKDYTDKNKSVKMTYDGRTRSAKSFIKRIEALRAKRSEKFSKQVKENMDDFRSEQLTEDNVAILRDIVKRKQNNMIKLKDGKLRVDLFTASAITQALDKRLNKDNQKKVMDIINNGSKGQFMKIVGVVMK